MSTVVSPLSRAELKRRVIEFAHAASTEIAPHDAPLLPELAARLPAGTTVYVAHTPKASLGDIVQVALQAQSHGFRASPHIVARRIASRSELAEGLRALAAGGVQQLLLVAGDRDPPAGEFRSSLEILESGLTVDAGFKSLGVAGHPEGHPAVSPDLLWDALKRKQAFADRTGTLIHINTQFGFNPDAICNWQRQLTERGISLPVHVGIAGPTPLPKLLKYAVACGIGASFSSLMKNVGAMSKLARLATTPDAMLLGLVRGCASGDTRLAKPHFYAFGGTIATADWLAAVIAGRFELDADGEKFILNS